MARILRSLQYELATAEILYHMPDYPSFLQTYVWQEYDIPPGFERLRGFLNFWDRNLDGKVFQVRVASATIWKTGYRSVDFLKHMH